MTSSSYSSERVHAVLIKTAVPRSYRIFPTIHDKTPLGTAPSDSRFSDKDSGFAILYAAPNFATSFIEVVVRDRFTRTKDREIALKEVTLRSNALVSSKPRNKLSLLDLRKDGCARLGAPTDAVNARNHAAGRALGRDIHANHEIVDGFLFSSRLTGEDVYAIFDRAIPKLKAEKPEPLAQHDELPNVLHRHDIRLVVRNR